MAYRTIKKLDLKEGNTAADVAASFQRTAVMHLIARTRRAMEQCRDRNMFSSSSISSSLSAADAKGNLGGADNIRSDVMKPTLVVAGGVARNAYLRGSLQVIFLCIRFNTCLRTKRKFTLAHPHLHANTFLFHTISDPS